MWKNFQKERETSLHCRLLLSKKFLYNFFIFIIISFSKMRMSHVSIFIYKIKCWPILIIKGFPEFKIIIQCNRIDNSFFFNSWLYIIFIFFISKLWCMNPNNDESCIFIFLMPSVQIWPSSLTVYTPKCPKIYKYDFTTKGLHSNWSWVDPLRKLYFWSESLLQQSLSHTRTRIYQSYSYICLIHGLNLRFFYRNKFIQKSCLDTRHIKSFEYISFEFFIESCYDHESYQYKNTSNNSLEHRAFICYNAKFCDNRTA